MNIKRIIDISRKIYPGMACWPDDESFHVRKDASIKKGDSCNLTSVGMSTHTGTHIDAPLHFIDDGLDIASMDLSKYIGTVKVFELSIEKCIKAEDLHGLDISVGDIVFFKTHNSLIPETEKFKEDYIYLDESAARLLAEKCIKTVGVDYLSVDGFSSDTHSTHKILLSAGIGIIEGLYLKDVKEGTYFFSCLPLNIQGSDGSPARAVLVEF